MKQSKIIRFAKIALFSCIIIQLTGCAAIFIPKKQKITINTGNPNSTVYFNNEEFGKGEIITGKVVKDGTKQVTIQTVGFKDEHYVLLPVKKHPAYYPLLILSGVTFYGCVVDMAPLGKFNNYRKISDFRSSFKLENKTSKEKFVNLSSIKLDIKDKNKDIKEFYNVTDANPIFENIKDAETRGQLSDARKELREEKKKGNKKTLAPADVKIAYDDTKFSVSIYKTLKTTGYIDTINKVFQDNNNTLTIEGVIKKANVYHIWNKARSAGYIKAKVNIIWNIRNSFGERLDSIEDFSFSGDFDNTNKYEVVFGDAVEISYLNLLKNKQFIKYSALDTVTTIKDPLLKLTKVIRPVSEVSDAGQATVTIKRDDKGHGSGFVISHDGYILTNFHVIAGKSIELSNITVVLSDGEEVPVTVVRFNRMRDIALLKVERKFESAFVLSTEKTFKNLIEVYTIGTPKSIELGQSVSLGLISNERKSGNGSVIQLSMSVNAGNSGGPLFQKNGVLHGVVTSKLVGYSTEGVGFAIPSYLIPGYLNIAVK